MAPPKRYWAKLKVPSSFLKTLPNFPTPISKSRLKKIAAEERKVNSTSTSTGGSKVGSPAPSTGENNGSSTNLNNLNNGSSGATISNFKINSGLKESSTSGLTMNSITSGLYALDKSGKPSKKWVKKTKQFKTFSGFKVKYVSFAHKDEKKKPSVSGASASTTITTTSVPVIKEEASPTPIVSASSTPDIRTEA
ncbi:INO80 complex subunit Ies4-domain-containing protein [Scheffersomyces amazonensis]|uniref:INO80 complex subunit Ies4-domain-containing protein n=1 Tax=Scheffersomyces amazonensis TaxID=1078765 RepID=UPI00315E0280